MRKHLLILLLGAALTLPPLTANPANAAQPAKAAAPSRSEEPSLDYVLPVGQYARFETNRGKFLVELDQEHAAKTVRNFSALVEGQKLLRDAETGERLSRFLYRDLKVSRVYPDMAIQTGCPYGEARGVAGFYLPDESQPSMQVLPGTLFMAPQDGKISGSQFVVTCGRMKHLDGKVPVFGKVIYGLDVVRKLSRTPYGFRQKPSAPCQIEQIRMVEVQPTMNVTVARALEGQKFQPNMTQDEIDNLGKAKPIIRPLKYSDPRTPRDVKDLIGTPAETLLNPMVIKSYREHQWQREIEQKLKERREQNQNKTVEDTPKSDGPPSLKQTRETK